MLHANCIMYSITSDHQDLGRAPELFILKQEVCTMWQCLSMSLLYWCLVAIILLLASIPLT